MNIQSQSSLFMWMIQPSDPTNPVDITWNNKYQLKINRLWSWCYGDGRIVGALLFKMSYSACYSFNCACCWNNRFDHSSTVYKCIGLECKQNNVQNVLVLGLRCAAVWCIVQSRHLCVAKVSARDVNKWKSQCDRYKREQIKAGEVYGKLYMIR